MIIITCDRFHIYECDTNDFRLSLSLPLQLKKGGQPLLMVALAEGHGEVVEVLMKRGADHSITDKVCCTANNHDRVLLYGEAHMVWLEASLYYRRLCVCWNGTIMEHCLHG